MKFYTAVGQGISHWARMEIRLVQVTAKVLATSEEKAGLLMYSINFYAWLDIISQLFELDGTYPRSFKKWRKLSEALKAENDTRVRLAHHSISQDREIVGGITGIQAYLKPARLDVRKKTKTHALKPLDMNEIADFTGRIGGLHGKLIALLKLMERPRSSR